MTVKDLLIPFAIAVVDWILFSELQLMMQVFLKVVSKFCIPQLSWKSYLTSTFDVLRKPVFNMSALTQYKQTKSRNGPRNFIHSTWSVISLSCCRFVRFQIHHMNKNCRHAFTLLWPNLLDHAYLTVYGHSACLHGIDFSCSSLKSKER